MPERTAIIDADIVAYKSAILMESGGDPDDLKELVQGMLRYWMKQSMCRHAIACLSCPTATGFRKAIHPDYKGNRRKLDRPENLVLAREIIRDTMDTIMRPRIEADDLLGILATNGYTDYPVMVTIDKDLRQIPGWHCNPDKEDHPHLVTPDQGMRHFCTQWLTGDSTDNYCGIPGIGAKKAHDWLDIYAEPGEHLARAAELWEDWEAKGNPFEAKLVQARMAWILRSDDWDEKTGKIRLFNPYKPERYCHDRYENLHKKGKGPSGP